MTKIAVMYGSRSVEHDVSVVTALQLMDNALGFEVLPIYIGREGGMFTGDGLRKITAYQPFDPEAHIEVTLEPFTRSFRRVDGKRGLFGKNKPEMYDFDVVIPALHGLNGEDGTVQGLLELCNVPYTSAGMLGSASCMDKGLMKDAMRGAGIPVLPYKVFGRDRWDREPDTVLEELEAVLPYPMYVKPANLGSSIGISKAEDREGLRNGIDIAVHFDRRIIVEQGLTDMMEINCSGLGYGDEVQASVCEQPLTWQTFLTFEDKYLAGGKSGAKTETKTEGASMTAMGRIIPAPIPDEDTEYVQKMTIDLFKMFDLKGVVRIDYMRDQTNGQIYVNEINTIPGSFACSLWEASGISYPQLIQKMTEYAKAAHAQKNRNRYAFESQLLTSFGKGSKGTK